MNPKTAENNAQPDLAALWTTLATDPSTPDRFELTEHSEIVLDPWPSNQHQLTVARAASQIREQLGDHVLYRIALLTASAGVRVPDLVWIPGDFIDRAMAKDPMEELPPLVIEVLSQLDRGPVVAHKIEAYLESGAREVAVLTLDGSVAFYRSDGVHGASSLGLRLSPDAGLRAPEP